MAAASTAASPPCRNCGHALTPADHYCAQCGQLARLRPLTVRAFIREYGYQYLGPKGSLWRTLALLLARPGLLTQEFLQGRRRRYLHPFRLYLVVSVLFFLLAGVAARFKAPIEVQAVDQVHGGVAVELDGGKPEVSIARQIDCDPASWLCAQVQRRYDLGPRELQRELAQLPARFIGYLGYGMFVLMPLFALLLMAAYRRRRLLYAEHLVFTLHLHTFWFIGMGVVAVTPAGVDTVALLWLAAYGLLALQRVYCGRWLPLLARAAALTLAYLLLAALVAAGVGAVALLV
jgi:hypothetical protein